MAPLKDLDKKIMVVTSTYVIDDKMPVLNVSNEDDEEGGNLLQFHCGNGDYDMKKMLLVKLETILNTDKTLANLNLSIGQEAYRRNGNDEWIII